MPEAIEAILIRGSRVQPRVALLKPISAAVSIGSGGPFGAEGPIIMTGGAVGAVLAQLLRTSADERKTLLVAGAAGGMAATFNAPLASVVLAVELLLFEWRPAELHSRRHRSRREHGGAMVPVGSRARVRPERRRTSRRRGS
jgi:chloride channel protein, CIC family